MTSTFDPTLPVRLAALGPLRVRVTALLAWLPPPSGARIGFWSGAAQGAFEEAVGDLRARAVSAADAVAAAQALTGRAIDDA